MSGRALETQQNSQIDILKIFTFEIIYRRISIRWNFLQSSTFVRSNIPEAWNRHEDLRAYFLRQASLRSFLAFHLLTQNPWIDDLCS